MLGKKRLGGRLSMVIKCESPVKKACTAIPNNTSGILSGLSDTDHAVSAWENTFMIYMIQYFNNHVTIAGAVALMLVAALSPTIKSGRRQMWRKDE